ncbi:hypothetical protein WAE56_02435 [Iodobacter sp. LRB]|uniref:hypothetical protein n=1 Tax=unclassified Iodobacter TaxID=235634 RepID=UPI000C11317B|nr:hypothetical protein [Iodobacter sp. BJB302]PHV03587.1 hypothetical protein CSQ88_01240 [Iodobacter sp. BJB302]
MRADWVWALLCVAGFAQGAALQISGASAMKPLSGEVESARLEAGAAYFKLAEGEAVVAPWPLAWRALPEGTQLLAERAPHPAGPVSRLRLLNGDQPWLEMIAGGYAGTVVQDGWRLGFKEGKALLVLGDKSQPFLSKMRMKDQAGARWCLRLLATHDAPKVASGMAQEAQIKADWLRYLPRKGRCE